MADRTLVKYTEVRNPDGPYWTLTVERSAAGSPAVLITIKTETASLDDRHIKALNHEMTIVVDDVEKIIGPLIEWLGNPYGE